LWEAHMQENGPIATILCQNMPFSNTIAPSQIWG
jgi:hypothetical protein